jgi:hypothetical protein
MPTPPTPAEPPETEARPAWRVSMATSSRPGRSVNEDLVAVEGNAAWLLDGASVPADLDRCCQLDARWYVEQLSSALKTALAGGASITLVDALAAAISQVEERHRSLCTRPELGYGPSCTVAIVRLTGKTLDYLLLGDSTVLLDFGGDVLYLRSDKRLKQVATPLRRKLRTLLAQGGGFTDPAYVELLRALVTEERAARNQPGGYWIASNLPLAAAHSITGTEQVGPFFNQVKTVALLSDGLERYVRASGIFPPPGGLPGFLLTKGPARCIDRVRTAEASDPNGLLFPRTSAADDASAILLELA